MKARDEASACTTMSPSHTAIVGSDLPGPGSSTAERARLAEGAAGFTLAPSSLLAHVLWVPNWMSSSPSSTSAPDSRRARSAMENKPSAIVASRISISAVPHSSSARSIAVEDVQSASARARRAASPKVATRSSKRGRPMP